MGTHFTSLHSLHFTTRRKEVDSVGRLKDSTFKTSAWMAWTKLKGFSTVRARLAFFWLEILLKIKPNEKCESLNFWENLKIWLEILNKKTLKILTRIIYRYSKTFVHKIQKIQIPIRNFFFVVATLQLFLNIKPITKLACTFFFSFCNRYIHNV